MRSTRARGTASEVGMDSGTRFFVSMQPRGGRTASNGRRSNSHGDNSRRPDDGHGTDRGAKNIFPVLSEPPAGTGMPVWMPYARRPEISRPSPTNHHDHMVPTRIHLERCAPERPGGRPPRFRACPRPPFLRLFPLPHSPGRKPRRSGDTQSICSRKSIVSGKSGQFSISNDRVRGVCARTSPPVFEMGPTRASRKNRGEAFCWPGKSSRATEARAGDVFTQSQSPSGAIP
jgi:hypothetical protein